MRYTGPKAKRARRLGMAFTTKDAKVLQRRGYPPGQHGQGRSRISEFGQQLREKQKAKVNYGVLERQFRRYFEQALKTPGVTGDNLLRFLELRLDNVAYRLGFADSRAQARQLVSHGFLDVNGKKVDIASYQVKVGDAVSIRAAKQKSAYVERLKEKLKNFHPQEWVQVEPTKLSGKVLGLPTPDMIGSTINTQLIVEHYSR